MLISFLVVITAAVNIGQGSTTRRPVMVVEGAQLDRVLGLYPVFIGSTVNITCSLDQSATRLRMMLLGDVLNVSIVDKDTVMIRSSHQTAQRYFYRCCVDQCPPVWMNDQQVARVTLQYVYPSVGVDGFYCVSPDYRYINCSWSLHERTPFVWNITFSIPGWVSKKTKECPTPSVFGNNTVYSCVIGLSNEQEFYKTQDYSIRLSGVSDFSTSTWNGTIHAGINIVQYSAIRKVDRVNEPRQDEFTVNWTRPVVISGTQPHYKVVVNRLQSDLKKHVATYNTTRTIITVPDLDPGVTYQVDVQAKPEQSPYWSNSRSLLVTTATGSSKIGLIVGVSLAAFVIVLVAFIIYRRRHLLYKYDITIPRTMPDKPQGPDDEIIIPSRPGHDHRASDSGVEVDNSSTESARKPEDQGIITQSPEVAQDNAIVLGSTPTESLTVEVRSIRRMETSGDVFGRTVSSTQETTSSSHDSYVVNTEITHTMSGESNHQSLSSYVMMENETSYGNDRPGVRTVVGTETMSSVSGQQSISSYVEVQTECSQSSSQSGVNDSGNGNSRLCKVIADDTITWHNNQNLPASVKEDTKTNFSFNISNAFALESTNENMSDNMQVANGRSSSSTSHTHLNKDANDSRGIVHKITPTEAASVHASSSDSGSMSSYVKIEHETNHQSRQSGSNAGKTISFDVGHQESFKDAYQTTSDSPSKGLSSLFVSMDDEKWLKSDNADLRNRDVDANMSNCAELLADGTMTWQSSQHMTCSSVKINDQSWPAESKESQGKSSNVRVEQLAAAANAASAPLEFCNFGFQDDEFELGHTLPVKEQQIDSLTIPDPLIGKQGFDRRTVDFTDLDSDYVIM